MRTLAVSLAVAALLISLPAGGITFDDGLVHVIDAANSYPFEGVVVDDDPSGATTRIQVVIGGEIGTGANGPLEAFGVSKVDIFGGELGSNLNAHDASRVNVWAGTVNPGGSLVTRDMSRVGIGRRSCVFGTSHK